MLAGWVATIGIIHYNAVEPNKNMTVEVYCLQLDEIHVELNNFDWLLIGGFCVLKIASSCQDDTAEAH